jgi:hypothetical protein
MKALRRLATIVCSTSSADCERNEVAYDVKCNAVACGKRWLHCQVQVLHLGVILILRQYEVFCKWLTAVCSKESLTGPSVIETTLSFHDKIKRTHIRAHSRMDDCEGTKIIHKKCGQYTCHLINPVPGAKFKEFYCTVFSF